MRKNGLTQLTLFNTPIITLDPVGTCVLILSRTRFGIQRKVSLERVALKADKKLLSLEAKIMDSPEMKQLCSLDGATDRWLAQIALPSIFKFGAHVVPISQVRTLDAKLDDYKERRELLQRAVIGRAEKHIAEAKAGLGDLANDIKWPTPGQIEGAFSLRWRFLTMGLPEELKTVDPQFYEEERKKISQDLQETRRLIETALLEGFQQYNAWLIERLTPDPERKRKKGVKTTFFRKFREFLAMMPERNVIGNTELNELAGRARTMLEGLEPKDFQKGDLALTIKERFESIQGAVETQIRELPLRTIVFEDEPSQEAVSA